MKVSGDQTVKQGKARELNRSGYLFNKDCLGYLMLCVVGKRNVLVS